MDSCCNGKFGSWYICLEGAFLQSCCFMFSEEVFVMCRTTQACWLEWGVKCLQNFELFAGPLLLERKYMFWDDVEIIFTEGMVYHYYLMPCTYPWRTPVQLVSEQIKLTSKMLQLKGCPAWAFVRPQAFLLSLARLVCFLITSLNLPIFGCICSLLLSNISLLILGWRVGDPPVEQYAFV